MTQNIWLAFPAMTALLIQSWLFLHSNKRELIKRSCPLLLLFIALFGICFIELGTYSSLLGPNLLAMKFYYIFCFMGLTGIVIQAIQLAHLSFANPSFLSKVVLSLSIVLSAALLLSNKFISGFEFISYSYTRVSGPLYWVIQIFLASMILAAFAFLLVASRGETNTLDSKRSRVLLLAVTPLLLVGFLIIPLMQLGLSVNASVIFPTLTVYFLLVLTETEKRESLFAILIKLPFSEERKSYKEITNEIHDYLINTEICKVNGIKNQPLKTLTTSIENKIVDWAVGVSNGSQVQAASLLGVSSSSVCRKKKKQKV